MRKGIPVLAFLVFYLTCSNVSSAPIPVISAAGILTGARNIHIVVNGFDNGMWDVDFIDGTCAQVFSWCSQNPLPAIVFVESVVQQPWEIANGILHRSILIDSPAGMFDSFPNLTNGCQGPAVTQCSAISPEFVFNFSPASARVQGAGTGNYLGAGECVPFCSGGPDSFPLAVDFADDPTHVWAVWTRQPVPEPATSFSLGLALAVIVIGKLKKDSVRRKESRLRSR